MFCLPAEPFPESALYGVGPRQSFVIGMHDEDARMVVIVHPAAQAPGTATGSARASSTMMNRQAAARWRRAWSASAG